jgi:DNA modification methylase
MTDLATNVLYCGDNLDILRRYLLDAAVDLVYLDPPFNSNRDYNVIFRDELGSSLRSPAEPVRDILRRVGVHGEDRQQVRC